MNRHTSFIPTYIHTHTHTYTLACVRVYMYMYVGVRACVRVRVCVCVCVCGIHYKKYSTKSPNTLRLTVVQFCEYMHSVPSQRE